MTDDDLPILIVTGGRGYTDRATVNRELDREYAERGRFVVAHGACTNRKGVMIGADRLTDDWAVAHPDMPGPLRFFADWDNDGYYAAGPIRNRRMLTECRPRLVGVLAFPGGRGTADMAKIARLAGVPVRHVGGTDDTPRLFP